MHSNITPEVSTPLSTAARRPPARVDRVDRAHVVPVAAFDRRARSPGRRRARCRTAPARRRAPPGRCRRAARRRSRRESARRSRRRRRCGRRPARRRRRCDRRPPWRRRIIAAMRDDADLDPALGRDLVGHEREAVPVALLEFRDDLDAVDAADDASPGWISRSLRQIARCRLRRRSRRPSAGARPPPTAPSIRTERPVVGRRVEVLRHAAVAIGRHAGARPRRARRGSRARSVPRGPRSAPPALSRSPASTRTTARRWCGRCGIPARRTPRRGGRPCRTSRSGAESRSGGLRPRPPRSRCCWRSFGQMCHGT